MLVYLFFFDVERRFQPSLKRNGSYGDHPSIPIRHNAFVNPILTECGDTVRKVSSAVRRIKIVRNMTRPYLPMLEFDYRYAQLMKNFVADETEHRVMLDLDCLLYTSSSSTSKTGIFADFNLAIPSL